MGPFSWHEYDTPDSMTTILRVDSHLILWLLLSWFRFCLALCVPRCDKPCKFYRYGNAPRFPCDPALIPQLHTCLPTLLFLFSNQLSSRNRARDSHRAAECVCVCAWSYRPCLSSCDLKRTSCDYAFALLSSHLALSYPLSLPWNYHFSPFPFLLSKSPQRVLSKRNQHMREWVSQIERKRLKWGWGWGGVGR